MTTVPAMTTASRLRRPHALLQSAAVAGIAQTRLGSPFLVQCYHGVNRAGPGQTLERNFVHLRQAGVATSEAATRWLIRICPSLAASQAGRQVGDGTHGCVVDLSLKPIRPIVA